MMESITQLVSLATSSPGAFVIVLTCLLASIAIIYFTYRILRDLEVFFLERQRLQDELNFGREESEQWDSSQE